MPSPGSPAPTSKICIACKRDCSARPRSKDSQGRYTCKDCSDKLAGQRARSVQAAPVVPPALQTEAEEPGADWMWDNAQAEPTFGAAPSAPAAATACPSCRTNMPGDAIACPACGHNILTGQKTPKSKGKSEGSGSGAGALSGVASKGLSILVGKNPLVWAFGGMVGGAIGAGIWAGLALTLNLEVGYVAWGVGILSGIGVAICARDNAGMISGSIAVIIALASIAAGKYLAVSMLVEKHVPKSLYATTPEDDADISIAQIAEEIAREREARGDKMYWPEGMTLSEAGPLTDYPGDVQNAAKKQWEGASAFWRQEFIQTHRITSDTIKKAAFLTTFSLFDLLWAFLAVGSAWGIGTGVGIDTGDD